MVRRHLAQTLYTLRRCTTASIALLGVCLAGSAAAAQTASWSAWSGLPRSAVVSDEDGLVIGLASRGSAMADGLIRGVRLRGEVADAAVARLGYASSSMTVDIDCKRRRDQVLRMEVFPAHGLKGQGRTRRVPGGWAQPTAGAAMAAVIQAICGGARPKVVRSEPEPSAPAPAPKAASEPAPQAASGFAAQIAAVSSQSAAQATLAGVSALSPAGVAGRVEPATSGGRTIYRAVVAGFGSRAAARDFCRRVAQAGGACFVK